MGMVSLDIEMTLKNEYECGITPPVPCPFLFLDVIYIARPLVVYNLSHKKQPWCHPNYDLIGLNIQTCSCNYECIMTFFSFSFPVCFWHIEIGGHEVCMHVYMENNGQE